MSNHLEAILKPFGCSQTLIWSFLLTYYVASPLLAYNVLSAFSIDVYQKIDEQVQDLEELSERCHIDLLIARYKTYRYI